MNPSHISGPLVASMLASMAAIGLWLAPVTTFVTLGGGAVGYWLGIQKIVSIKSPRAWFTGDLPSDPLASDFERLQLRQDIRETATTIAGLRQEFAATQNQYHGDLSRLSSRLSTLEGGTSRASSQLQTLQNNLQELNQRLSQDLKQLNDQLIPNGRSLTRLDTELTNIHQKLAAAILELNTRHDGLNRRIEPIETEIRRLSRVVAATRGNTAITTSPADAQLHVRLMTLERHLHTFASKLELQTLRVDIHSLTENYQRLNTHLHGLSNQLSNLSTASPVDLAPLQATVQQLTHELAKLRLDSQSIAAQISKPIADSGIDMKVIYGRTEALQQKMDFLKKRFKEIEDMPQPLLLWRDRPAPKERVAQRPDTHRVAVFVDGSNIVKSAEENRVPLGTTEYASNLLNFLENIQGSHSVYFHGFEINSEVSQTLKDIEALGYKVVKRKGRAGRHVKANMDSYIILEMLQYASAYDTAVLVSGDGDFIPIVHWLRSQHKRVEVLGIHKTVAFGLQDAADSYEAIRVGKHLTREPV